ncbi:MAG: nitroreductase [Erysipelotrichaceae bacterium]|nr:nitroreductase [Erysipelotrichaceae bacterium]
MSEVLNNIYRRVSCRSYTEEPVSKEDLEKVVKAGLAAPTGMNRQTPIFLVVQDKETRDELSRVNAEIMGRDGDPFYGAPAVVVVLADKTFPTYLYDGSLAMGSMMLAATDLGLGSCWIHRAKETFEREEGKALLKKLGVEGEYEGIGNLILGHPKGELPQPKEKREGRVFCI